MSEDAYDDKGSLEKDQLPPEVERWVIIARMIMSTLGVDPDDIDCDSVSSGATACCQAMVNWLNCVQDYDAGQITSGELNPCLERLGVSCPGLV